MPHPIRFKVPLDDTDYLLHFTRTSGAGAAWQCITPEWPVIGQHVDKDRKAALREHNDKFWEWMCSVGPMLHTTGWEHLQNLEQEAQEYVDATDRHAGHISPFLRRRRGHSFRAHPGMVPMGFPQTLALEIMKDYNHPLRIHLATSFLADNDIKTLASKEDSNRFRSAYNQWFNKQLGLMEEETK